MYVVIKNSYYAVQGFPGGVVVKKSICQCRRCELDPWVGKIPWSRNWPPTPVFLPGKLHEQRSLVGYHPWGYKESGMTEHACSVSTKQQNTV